MEREKKGTTEQLASALFLLIKKNQGGKKQEILVGPGGGGGGVWPWRWTVGRVGGLAQESERKAGRETFLVFWDFSGKPQKQRHAWTRDVGSKKAISSFTGDT